MGITFSPCLLVVSSACRRRRTRAAHDTSVMEHPAAQRVVAPSPKQGDGTMDKDRVEGSWEQVKGKAKEVAGKATGDSKTEAEGKAQKTAGKVQNTVGGLKDTLRGE